MRYGLINAGGIVVPVGQDLVERRSQNKRQTPELSPCLSDPPTENECQSPSPNQRDTCTADTADVRDEMRYVNVYTFNLPMEYTHVRSRGNSAPNMADRWQWRTAAGAECEGSRSVRAALFTPLKGLACANATFTHVYSVMGPQLNTHKELCGGSGSACVNTAAPHATFLCNSQFLGALSASGLPAPLGIASLMNANGKGLIQLKSMNNGGAWCCSAAPPEWRVYQAWKGQRWVRNTNSVL